MPKVIDYYGDSTVWSYDPNTSAQASPTVVETFAANLTTSQTYTVNNKGVSGQGTRRLLGIGAEAGYGGVNPLDQLLAASDADFCIYNHCLNDADPFQENNTVDTYKANMQKVVDLTRYYGKYCIFETPNVCSIIDYAAYMAAMLDVARANNVPVIDVNKYTNDYIVSKGLAVTDICPDGEHPKQTTYDLIGKFAASEFKTITESTIMTHIIEDRVCEVSTTTGTGPFVLTGARSAAFKRFNEVCGVGDTVYGVIEAVDANGVATGEWVAGLFTYSAVDTISVTTVYSSSNNNAAVNFSAGSKFVNISLIAYHIKLLAAGTAPGGGPTNVPVYPVAIPATDVSALTFRDEFDAAALNTNVWNTHVWYEGEPDTVNYTLEDSCLKIWPQRNGSGQFFNRTIDTDGKFYQKYGYWEARMKLPIGYGCWPAFWIFGHETDDRPEIDVMEAYPGGENAGNGGWSDTNNHPLNAAMTIHAPTVNDIIGSKYVSDVIPFGNVDLSADFHVWGCKWTSTGVSLYFDDQLCGTIDVSAVPSLQVRLYTILDLWFGNASGDPNAGGATPPTGVANSFQIDYVRVWSLS